MKDYLKVLELLRDMHPDAHCELNYRSPFELLTAVILSAQCTDKRVNMITEKLFAVYNTAEQFAALEQEELERYIYSAGFYRNKAKNIILAAKSIAENFGGEVPSSVEELQRLPGVGRKTANVVYSVAYGGSAIAVDTHVFRVANRLALADAKTPEKTELQLNAFIPEEYRTEFHHLLIFHGRYICKSQNPNCAECKLKEICKSYTDRSVV